MSQTKTTNNTHTTSVSSFEYDPTFTDNVIAATGPRTSARLKEVMPALIRHVHDFAREVNLTTEEYMAGIELINWAGRMSNDRRNEGQLLTDVIGLESRRDHIQTRSRFRKLSDSFSDSWTLLANDTIPEVW